MSTQVILGVSANEGYAPEQIKSKVTLQDLLEAVEEAIENFGEDAQIVLDNGQIYGARYGCIVTNFGEIEFEEVEDDEEEED